MNGIEFLYKRWIGKHPGMTSSQIFSLSQEIDKFFCERPYPEGGERVFYHLVTDFDYNSFVKEVDDMIKKGWNLHGSLVCILQGNDILYAREMTKELYEIGEACESCGRGW